MRLAIDNTGKSTPADDLRRRHAAMQGTDRANSKSPIDVRNEANLRDWSDRYARWYATGKTDGRIRIESPPEWWRRILGMFT